jgi:hypothetical protein
MHSTSRTRRAATAAALVAAGAVGATAITGFAFASDGEPGSAARTASVAAVAGTTGAAGATGASTGRRGGMLRDVLHGELTVKATEGTRVVDVQRGKVTAASATSLTVASSDGFSATYAVSSSTVVRKLRQPVPVGTLAVGDEVLLRSSDGTATLVRAR